MDYNYMNSAASQGHHPAHPVTEYMHPPTAHTQHAVYQQSVPLHQTSGMPYTALPPEFRLGMASEDAPHLVEVSRNDNLAAMIAVQEHDVQTTLLQMQNLAGSRSMGYSSVASDMHQRARQASHRTPLMTSTSHGKTRPDNSPPSITTLQPRVVPTAITIASTETNSAPVEPSSAPTESIPVTVEEEEASLGGPLPEGLVYSKVGPKTVCVIADRVIPKGVRFGPYKGAFGKGPIHFNNILSWEMTLQGKVVGFLSPVKGEKAWSTMVRAAQYPGEMTAEADQFNGRIYFTTIKEIQPGEEFKVFYSDEYRQSCGYKLSLDNLKYNPESRGFECSFCPCHCSNPKSLLRHIKLFHNKEKQPDIDVEVQQVNDDSDTPQEKEGGGSEVSEVSEGGRFICPTCGKSFNSQGRLIMHEKFHKNVPVGSETGGEVGDSFPCHSCGFICPTVKALESHLAAHKNAQYGCDECGCVFTTLRGLTNHKKAEHKVIGPDNKLKIKLRVRMHPTGRNCCKMCGYTCAGPKEFKSHKQGHKQYPFGCPECGCLYKLKASLLEHLKERHSTVNPDDPPKQTPLQAAQNDQHKCAKCGFKCIDEETLKMHVNYHYKAPYGCDICGLVYTQKQFVTRHKRVKHGTSASDRSGPDSSQSPWICVDCNKSYVNQKSLARHQKTVHGKTYDPHYQVKDTSGPGDFECDLCLETFSTPTAFNSHLQQAHGIEPHPSDLKKGFIRPRKPRGSPSAAGGPAPKNNQSSVLGSTRCYICGKTFIKYSFLHDHLRQHHGIEPLTRGGSSSHHEAPQPSQPDGSMPPPAEVQEKTDQIDMLGKPMDYYNRPRPFKCKLCPRRFVYRHVLKRHEYKVHLGGSKFTCSFCQKGFDMESQLLVHVQKHTKNRPFKCALCPKSFASKSAHDNHQGEHTGEKPHKCDVCDRGFRTRKQMTKHKYRVHSNKEKKFVCSFCGKRFLMGKDHKIHERRHKGIRPYVCLSCGKAFKDKHCRDVHMRIHTGEKPYVCDQCGKAYSLPHRLTDHIVMHTKANMEQAAAVSGMPNPIANPITNPITNSIANPIANPIQN